MDSISQDLTAGCSSPQPLSSLATAASAPTHSIEQNISAEPLRAALQALPPAPSRPTLQRIPATRLAKEQDEAEPDDEETAGPILPLAEQKRIVAKVEQLMALVDQLEAQQTAARATSANLLAALVAELTGTSA